MTTIHAHDDAALMREILALEPAFTMLVGPDLRIRFLNRVSAGMTLSSVIGRHIDDFIPAEHRATSQHAIDEAFRTGEPQSYAIKGAGPHYSVAYYESRAVPVTYRGERLVCVLALEVTEHAARAEALHQREEQLRVAVDATGIGLWSLNLATGKLEGSPRVYEIMGTDEEFEPETYVERLVHPEDRARVRAAGQDVLRGTGSFASHRIVRPDGAIRWVVPAGRLVRDDAGNPTRVLGGTLDITAQREFEEQLQRAQKLDSIGALTAGVAHNFNNMLAVIVPTLDLAMRQTSGGLHTLLTDAAHAATRASEMVAQLMMFAGQRCAPLQTQSLVPVVERAVTMCRGLFPANLAIEAELAHKDGSVHCDAAAIEQVIVNLLINARDAVVSAERPRSRVRVELSEVTIAPPGDMQRPSSHFRVAVIDDGTGMDDAIKQHLFQPFFTTKVQGKGTGLGLATSYAIVRDHAGFITVDSVPGVGTTMAVYLPNASAQPAAPDDTQDASPSRRSATILHVDDEPAVRSVVAAVFSARGHVVIEASSAEQALALIDAGERPEVIVLDRGMAGLPGKRVIAELQARLPGVPLVYFTGQDVSADESQLVAAVLYKPLSADELTAAIEALLPQ